MTRETEDAAAAMGYPYIVLANMTGRLRVGDGDEESTSYWLAQNCTNEYIVLNYRFGSADKIFGRIAFKSQEAATVFKLKFGI